MIVTLLLPWFPIVLAVGVGGRLLGRSRGLGLGILCALFWIVLVQASAGLAVWRDPWTVVTLVAGAIAIGVMGLWSGEVPTEKAPAGAAAALPSSGVGASRFEPASGGFQDTPRDEARDLSTHACSAADLRRVCAAVDRFDDWLMTHRDHGNPWPKFDEFLRSVLYECCQATHVKPYRLSSEGEVLTPLCDPDPLGDEERLCARRGIVGHVVTTGRPYIAGDTKQGELVNRLAVDSHDSTAWCFAVRQGSRRLGVVVVGRLGTAPELHKPLFDTVERLVSQFWSTLTETALSRSAVQVDPVSGLYSRAAFLRAAEESLKASYRQGEPVAVVVIALEGLREINDSGRWEVSDDLLREVSDALRRNARMDDRLGRFDGSRIVLLLRRVDSQLASLIVNQMVSRVTAVCSNTRAGSNETRWGAKVRVRCGVSGSGTAEPTLRSLMSRALQQCRRARLEERSIADDLASSLTTSEAPA